jgi:hypothetical protein
LYLQTVGKDNSIMLSSYLLLHQRQIYCPLLVDSGCSTIGFIDSSFAYHHRIPYQRLAKPRPLHLADGVLSSFITATAPVHLRIGHHYEKVDLFITKLSPGNPIILGLPWLQEHNPSIDWETSVLTFSTKCEGRCFATNLPAQLRHAPRAASRIPLPQPPSNLPPSNRHRHMSMEEVPDEGEPQDEVPTQEEIRGAALTPHRREKRAEYQRQRRSHQRFEERLGRGPPVVTKSPTGSQARLIADYVPVAPRPVQPTAGVRRPAAYRSPSLSTPRRPGPRNMDPLDETDIRLFNILAFANAAKQEGVDVSVTSWAELLRATEVKEPIELPQVPGSVYGEILHGRGDPDTYKKLFPQETHEFIDQCYGSASIRRISDEDAQIFLDKSEKGPMPLEEIRKRVPAKYHDLIAAFLPQDAEKLAPHRRYDHKIELIPGATVPYARSRPLSPLELRVLKRWLDDNLAKG